MNGLHNFLYYVQDFLGSFSGKIRIIRSRFEISGVLGWMDNALCVLSLWESELKISLVIIRKRREIYRHYCSKVAGKIYLFESPN